MPNLGQWYAVCMKPRPFIVGASIGHRTPAGPRPVLMWEPEDYRRGDPPPALGSVILMTREQLHAEEWGRAALEEWDAGEDAGYREWLEATGLSTGPSLRLVES